jgi:hypothetical protein
MGYVHDDNNNISSAQYHDDVDNKLIMRFQYIYIYIYHGKLQMSN